MSFTIYDIYKRFETYEIKKNIILLFVDYGQKMYTNLHQVVNELQNIIVEIAVENFKEIFVKNELEE